MRPRFLILLGILVPPVLGSCGGGADAGGSVIHDGVVRDSAGVRIVEHAGIPEDLPVWTISDEPSLSIGNVAGTGPDVFTSVNRIVVRSDGVIVLTDWVPGELKAFTPDGTHLWTSGRIGEGPGEFAGFGGSATIYLGIMPGDSVLAYDASRRRMQVFGPAGAYVRGFPIEVWGGMSGSPRFAGTTRGGFVIRASEAGTRPALGEPPARPTYVLSLVSWTGVPIREMARMIGAGGIRLAPDAVDASTGGAFVAGDQHAFEIFRYDDLGAVSSIIRIAKEPAPVGDEHRGRFLERMLRDANEAARARMLDAERSAAYSDVLPAYGEIMLDAAGRLWVADYVPIYEDVRGLDWTVFGTDGAVVARATMPEGFTPHHIGADEVIGVWQDELRLAYVHVRPILRTEAP